MIFTKTLHQRNSVKAPWNSVCKSSCHGKPELSEILSHHGLKKKGDRKTERKWEWKRFRELNVLIISINPNLYPHSFSLFKLRLEKNVGLNLTAIGRSAWVAGLKAWTFFLIRQQRGPQYGSACVCFGAGCRSMTPRPYPPPLPAKRGFQLHPPGEQSKRRPMQHEPVRRGTAKESLRWANFPLFFFPQRSMKGPGSLLNHGPSIVKKNSQLGWKPMFWRVELLFIEMSCLKANFHGTKLTNPWLTFPGCYDNIATPQLKNPNFNRTPA